MSKKSRRSRRQHDKVYRRIFSHPSIIEEILRLFVAQPWVSKLDFSTLETMPTSFVNLTLERRESDLLWRARYGEGEHDWFYVFILMELQSKVERFMALRMLGYYMLIAEAIKKHEDLLASKRPKLLPPILPVVLYNGERPWTAPLSLAELFKAPPGFDLPDFRYVLIDVRSLDSGQLRPVDAVSSGVFLMEQAHSVEELRAVVDELEGLIASPDLEADIANLVRDVAVQLDLADEEVPPMRSLREVKMSLLQRAEKWTKEWFADGKAEGLAEGLAEGEARGRRLGKAESLKVLADRKFGKLPASILDQIDRADIDRLDHWLERLLVAKSMEDVFS